MKGILAAGTISLIVSLFGTPFAIRLLRKRGYGQLIRDDGPTTHHTKRGTPTMGGTVILLAAILGYVAGNMVSASGPTASGLLVLGLATGLGLVGFLDDFIKVRMQRNLGLRARTKLLGQTLVAVVFGVLVLQFPDELRHSSCVDPHLVRARHDGGARGRRIRRVGAGHGVVDLEWGESHRRPRRPRDRSRRR